MMIPGYIRNQSRNLIILLFFGMVILSIMFS